MNYKSYYTYIAIAIAFSSYNKTEPFSFKDSLNRAYTWVRPGSKMQEEIIQKEFAIAKNGILTVKNINGPITIQTEWNQNSVFVKTIKKVPAKEEMGDVDILHSQTQNNLNIRTVHKNPKSKASVSYTLIVPSDITVNVATQNGNITVNHIKGAVNATTDNGNVQIKQAHNTVIAHTNQKGNISIEQALGNVQAHAKKGSISIADAHSSVIAHTEYGKIDLHSTKVPPTGTIKLSTISGNIMLHMPEGVNADLHAQTKYGTVQCAHYITLKPQTIKLDKNSWKQFRKEVAGTLGSGEAQIVLNSNKSNIKILETKTT